MEYEIDDDPQGAQDYPDYNEDGEEVRRKRMSRDQAPATPARRPRAARRDKAMFIPEESFGS